MKDTYEIDVRRVCDGLEVAHAHTSAGKNCTVELPRRAILSHYSTGVREGLLRLMSTAWLITVEHQSGKYDYQQGKALAYYKYNIPPCHFI